MAKIPVIKVNGRRDNLDEIMQDIKSELEKKGRYHPNLMYRGVAVNYDQLQSILEHGTDKTVEGEEAAFRQRREKVESRNFYDPIDNDEMFNYLLESYKAMNGGHLTQEELELAGASATYEIEDNLGRKDLFDDKDPRKVWLFPEEKADECINTYAFSNLEGPGEIPVLVVYEPDAFLRVGSKHDGKEIKDIPRWSLLDENDAFYKFKDSVKPIDALVAVVRLDG